MDLDFRSGDNVEFRDTNDGIFSGTYTIQSIFGNTIELINDEGIEFECEQNNIQHVVKTFAVYYQHDYGSTQWIIKSPVFPTQEQIVELLSLDFEPEREEFIAIEEITTINVLTLS